MSIIVCCGTPFALLVLKRGGLPRFLDTYRIDSAKEGGSPRAINIKQKVSGTFRCPRSGGYGTAHRMSFRSPMFALLEQGMNVPIRNKRPSPFRAESMSYQINLIQSFPIKSALQGTGPHRTNRVNWVSDKKVLVSIYIPQTKA